MTSLTWKSFLGGDWGTEGDWAPAGGPPGGQSSGLDFAVLGPAGGSYIVTVAGPEIFDIETLTMIGASTADTTNLSVAGALYLNSLDLQGPGGDASILVHDGGQLLIRNSLIAANSETINISGGEVELGSAILDGINIGTTNVTFNFVGNGGLFEINSSHFRTGEVAHQTITNLGPGDTIQFDDANFTGDTFSYSGSTLTVTKGATTVLTMDHVFASAGSQFVGSGAFIHVVCFAAGTRILTEGGECPVERLRVGDMVRVLADHGTGHAPVKWIGRRRINLQAHPSPETACPVRIVRGAFDLDVPNADLLISPDHAIFVDDKLICARQLINGSSIRLERDRTSVEYFHVELETHAVIFANGLTTESYLDTGNRGFFRNGGALLELHPDLSSSARWPTREANSCAPFVTGETEVLPVWRQLAARAVEIGLPPPTPAASPDPELVILAGGSHLRPLTRIDGAWTFLIPNDTREVKLISRAASPTATRPWLDDPRSLGVAVHRIVLRHARGVQELPLDHPDLTNGWWDLERGDEAIWRWTDGRAALTLPAVTGPIVMELHAGVGAMVYPDEVEPERHAA